MRPRVRLSHHFIELLIHSYFNIVKREIIDMVPKAITLTLVSHSKDNLQRELLQELYKPEVLDDLLKESEYVVSRRKECISMVQALNKAEEYVPSCSCAMMHLTVASQDCRWCLISPEDVVLRGASWSSCRTVVVAYAYYSNTRCTWMLVP